MRALSFIGFVIAGFLIFVGVTSKGQSGAVLGNAVTVGGVIIILFVVGVWIAVTIKNKRKS